MTGDNDRVVEVLLRLTAGIKKRVDDAAKLNHTTASVWYRRVIEQALDGADTSSSTDAFAVPQEWNPLLALRLTQFSPVLFVLKHQGKILYPNPAYVRTFLPDRPTSWFNELVGKTIADLQPKGGLEIHQNVASPKDNKFVIEALSLPKRSGNHGEEKRIFRTIRFPAGKDNTGDFSFEWARMVNDEQTLDVDWELMNDQQASLAHTMKAIQKALEEAPIAIALKSPTKETRADGTDRGCIVSWCNNIFADAANRYRRAHNMSVLKCSDIQGKMSARDIWNLSAEHTLMRNERIVRDKGKWMYDEIAFENDYPRTTLRFPLLNRQQQVVWIAAISTDFKLDRHEETARVPARRKG